MHYILEYTPSNYQRRDNVRKTCLAVSILLDFVAIAMIVTAIFVPIYWIAVVVIALSSNTLRYIVNIYPKKYNYGVCDDKFSINEVTPLRTKSILSQSISDILNISSINYGELSISKEDNMILLYDNSCINNAYMIEFGSNKVVLPLDEYMYTLIKSVQKEERK